MTSADNDIVGKSAKMATDLYLGFHVSPEDAADLLRALNAEIERLRGEVSKWQDLAEAGVTLAEIQRRSEARIAARSIAPAEAKGDECNCPAGISKRDPEKHAPNCPVRTLPCRTLVNPFDAPQPADGGAVAWQVQIADVLECFWNAAIGSARGSEDSTAIAVSGSLAEGFAAMATRLRENTTPPVAQVQQVADFPMTDAQVRQWIGACNHEPARQVLRDYLQLRATHPTGDALGAVRELADQLRGELLHASPMLEATMYEKGRTSEKQRCIAMLDAIAPQTEAALRPSAGEGKGMDVSHKKHDGPCWRNSHADCGC